MTARKVTGPPFNEDEFRAWVNKVGEKKAMIKLIEADLSASLAVKLVNGKYHSALGRMNRVAIAKGMYGIDT